MEWQPIETAPKDGTSVLVPEQYGYTHAFYQDGYWWWHTAHDDAYAVGPTPKMWKNNGPTANTVMSEESDAPGSPYMPSNGTEGACFHEAWCAKCERDKVMNGSASAEDADKDPSLYCSILSKSFSVEQLPEWKHDDEGYPMCAAFVPAGNEVPEPRCTRTIDLFEASAEIGKGK